MLLAFPQTLTVFTASLSFCLIAGFLTLGDYTSVDTSSSACHTLTNHVALSARIGAAFAAQVCTFITVSNHGLASQLICPFNVFNYSCLLCFIFLLVNMPFLFCFPISKLLSCGQCSLPCFVAINCCFRY